MWPVVALEQQPSHACAAARARVCDWLGTGPRHTLACSSCMISCAVAKDQLDRFGRPGAGAASAMCHVSSSNVDLKLTFAICPGAGKLRGVMGKQVEGRPGSPDSIPPSVHTALQHDTFARWGQCGGEGSGIGTLTRGAVRTGAWRSPRPASGQGP